MDIKQQARLIIDGLYQLYPEADCTLDFKEPWKLLVSGILAAQCTDARVNTITPGLFKTYPTAEALAAAELSSIEDIIRSCGFFRVKSKSIKESMYLIVNEFDGEVPRTIDELLTLPGIGRKIANLILGDCFGIPSIVVDTHCSRISHHLGLTDAKDPHRIERDLAQVLPEEYWIGYGHRMVAHGRALCKARNPQCNSCALVHLCRKGLETIEQQHL
ncbi:MAG: endonuclease III [Saccharofermentanales bacterium]